jgi:hypothetical protein
MAVGHPNDARSEAEERHNLPQVLVRKLARVGSAFPRAREHVGALDSFPESGVRAFLRAKLQQPDPELLPQQHIEPQHVVRRFYEVLFVQATEVLLRDGNELVVELSKHPVEAKLEVVFRFRVRRAKRALFECSTKGSDVVEGFPRLLQKRRAAVQVDVECRIADEPGEPGLAVGVHEDEVP